MPTQPRSVTYERLKAVIVRWEQAVYAGQDAIGDDADAAEKELTESRADLLELLYEARLVVEKEITMTSSTVAHDHLPEGSS